MSSVEVVKSGQAPCGEQQHCDDACTAVLWISDAVKLELDHSRVSLSRFIDFLDVS